MGDRIPGRVIVVASISILATSIEKTNKPRKLMMLSDLSVFSERGYF